MFKVVGVLGAGQMGNGIAHVFAQHAYQVLLYDISEAQLEKALKSIEQNLERQAKKGVIFSTSIQGIMGRITVTKDLNDFSACDLVVEAVTENEALKFDLFRKLDEIVGKDAILASNTSSISITRIAAVTRRPDKVIGMHFMNPVPVMQLVEVIRGLATSDETFQSISSLVVKAGEGDGGLPGLSRLHRQPGPDPDDQRGGLCPLRRDRHRRGYRQGDEARHQSADGAADAGRLHRPRHGAGHLPMSSTTVSRIPSIVPVRCW